MRQLHRTGMPHRRLVLPWRAGRAHSRPAAADQPDRLSVPEIGRAGARAGLHEWLVRRRPAARRAPDRRGGLKRGQIVPAAASASTSCSPRPSQEYAAGGIVGRGMRPFLLVLATVFLPACAPMGEAQCRSTDWYALGELEGRIYGMRPRIDQYAYQCGRHGVQPAEKEYMA